MRAVAVLIVVGFAVLAPGSLGDHASPCLGWRLPAPITIAVGTTSYRIGCDERVRRIGRLRGSFTQGTSFGSAPGVWWDLRRGHLVVGHGRRTVWRSHGKFRSLFTVFTVEVGARAVAYSYADNLYLAPFRGAERLIGRQEFPLGFTRGGLYTISWLRGLLLRSDAGAIRKTFVHWTQQYFVARGRLYFIAHGELMRARGARVQRLASLASLGMSADTGLQPLATDPWSQMPSGLFELEDNNRLTVLRQDGSVFATTSARIWGGGGISSPPVVAPRANAVAFAATSGQGYATETAYVLLAGAHRAEAEHHERVHLGVCTGVGATVQWHGSRLLYSDTNGDLAVIDTTGASQVIDLTHSVRRLPGTRGGFTAYWAGEPPAQS